MDSSATHLKSVETYGSHHSIWDIKTIRPKELNELVYKYPP